MVYTHEKDVDGLKSMLTEFLKKNVTNEKPFWSGKELACLVLHAQTEGEIRWGYKRISRYVNEYDDVDILNCKGQGYTYLPNLKNLDKTTRWVVLKNLEIQLARKIKRENKLELQIEELKEGL